MSVEAMFKEWCADVDVSNRASILQPYEVAHYRNHARTVLERYLSKADVMRRALELLLVSDVNVEVTWYTCDGVMYGEHRSTGETISIALPGCARLPESNPVLDYLFSDKHHRAEHVCTSPEGVEPYYYTADKFISDTTPLSLLDVISKQVQLGLKIGEWYAPNGRSAVRFIRPRSVDIWTKRLKALYANDVPLAVLPEDDAIVRIRSYDSGLVDAGVFYQDFRFLVEVVTHKPQLTASDWKKLLMKYKLFQ
jgi:hypothetical protein